MSSYLAESNKTYSNHREVRVQIKTPEDFMNEIKKQRAYYARTAHKYDATFTSDPNDGHFMALSLLSGLLSKLDVKSLLDVGCGTGRAMQYLKENTTNITFTGLEPVEELRNEALKKGFSNDQIFDGDATQLPYENNQFDCVSLFGVLHHVRNPEVAIKECLRVAKKAIYISDHNIYGMGSNLTKFGKQALRDVGLRKLLFRLMTQGRGYHDTSWDGVFYPFSILDHIPLIQKNVDTVHCYPTRTFAINLYRDASHVAVLGIKEQLSEC